MSVEMARAYVVAATVWLDVWAFDRDVNGPSELEFSTLNAGIEARRKDAQTFLASYGNGSAGGGVSRFSVRDFRS